MDILFEIAQHKRQEVAQAKSKKPLAEMVQASAQAAAPRGFIRALNYALVQQQPAVIAEIKKASPSQGVIRADFDPIAIAKSYEHGGATTFSVLTDNQFFQGEDGYLQQIRNISSKPLLRKDFIIDEWQIYQSRCLGADCILLIAAILPPELLARFYHIATALHLDVLIEVHDADELNIAAQLNPRLIGINNRNLRTFEVDIQTTIQLCQQAPENCILVTESGIKSQADVRLMRANGVQTFLIGEAFMRCADPGHELKRLFQDER